jgi:epidermal growth factor receptor substrate 15
VHQRLKRRNDDAGDIVDLQKLIEAAVLSLCRERQGVGKVEEQKETALKDLQSIIAIVDSLKCHPRQDDIQQTLRTKLHDDSATAQSQKRRLLDQIKLLKDECERLEAEVRRRNLAVGEQNHHIGRLEEQELDQDDTIESCQESIDIITQEMVDIETQTDELKNQRKALLSEIAETTRNDQAILDLHQGYLDRIQSKRGELKDFAGSLQSLSISMTRQMISLQVELDDERAARIREVETGMASKQQEISATQGRTRELERLKRDAELQFERLVEEKEADAEKFRLRKQQCQSKLQTLQQLMSALSS